jgi:hypothetical protein
LTPAPNPSDQAEKRENQNDLRYINLDHDFDLTGHKPLLS